MIGIVPANTNNNLKLIFDGEIDPVPMDPSLPNIPKEGQLVLPTLLNDWSISITIFITKGSCKYKRLTYS